MFQDVIEKLVNGSSLTETESFAVMNEMMKGKATSAQIAAYLVALRCKGETVDEIVGSVRAMRGNCLRVTLDDLDAVDLCGTGGDGKGTFNISTTAAFVVAGTGVKVAKHGNRAASSKCGSADLLEELGVAIDLKPEDVATCVEDVGVGFIFAPLFHPAMKNVAPVRRELGVRTLFNLLGPLANPAGVRRQLVGVFHKSLMDKFAQSLQRLGVEHAVIVHCEGGYDEATTAGISEALMVFDDGRISRLEIVPEDLGFKRAESEALKGGSAKENADLTVRILEGEDGACADTVVLNSALALLSAGRTEDLKEGLTMAKESIKSGRAKKVLENLVKVSNSLSRGR